MKLLDAVRLRIDLPKHGLHRGALGAIVAVFDEPYPAYEVEFANDDGETIAQCALKPDQIELAF